MISVRFVTYVNSGIPVISVLFLFAISVSSVTIMISYDVCDFVIFVSDVVSLISVISMVSVIFVISVISYDFLICLIPVRSVMFCEFMCFL